MIRQYFTQGKLLDIGSANSAYVGYLRERGKKAFGIDLHLKPHLPHHIVGNVLSLPFRDKTFFVSTAFNILEHVDDQQLLREIKRVTSTFVLISVPLKQKDFMHEYGLAFHPYVDPTHLRYYDPGEFLAYVQSQGFAVVQAYSTLPINPLGLFLKMLRIPWLNKVKAKKIMKLPFIEKFYTTFHCILKIQ